MSWSWFAARQQLGAAIARQTSMGNDVAGFRPTSIPRADRTVVARNASAAVVPSVASQRHASGSLATMARSVA